ncbi:ABC transporter permease protein [Vagococcus fluvialis bH819]|uniref:ABC transporter permease protein n=2 Tax=Enterococcaceae TaxID=81852 RepID=A0A1X6WRF4_9ENTE|nr:ABC transporter permease protein [Vagococcus fluvialis bH819]
MVFFVFSLLYFHPDLGDQLKGSSDSVSEMAIFGISVAEVVIALMSFVFLWYAFNTFLKGRKKQLSIYLTLGMSEKKLKQMIKYENSLLGFSSILLGTVLGILFSKFILLITQNILYLEEGLPFYFPIKAIGLTWLVYSVIFILISFFTVIKLRKITLLEMRESTEDVFVAPKRSVMYTILGIILILMGYGLAFVFSYNMNGMLRLPINIGIGTLIICVLITILGTFLFFKFSSVNLFQKLKEKPLYFKNSNMLTISNLIHRMRTNAMMYFLISIVGAIAFVGIGVAKSIGSYDFGKTQGASFAIVYDAIGASDREDIKKIHRENISTVENMIKESKYDYISLPIQLIDILVEQENPDEMSGLLTYKLIKESDFNQLMSFMDKSAIKPVNDDEILKLVGSNSEKQAIKAEKLVDSVSKINMVSYKEDEEIKEQIKVRYSDVQLSLGEYGSLGVVTDKKYQELKNRDIFYYSSTQIIHFKEWTEDKALNNEISYFLKEKIKEQENKSNQIYEKIGKVRGEELTDEETEEVIEVDSKEFYYSSLYETWLKTKQSNGTILLISILLGSVFFTFSCSIIYFKLFGELEKDGKYHRSLYILGVTEKRRKRMVTTEMLIMFFIPFIISTVHFIAAMSALKVLIDLPVHLYIIQIVSVYIIFQVVFFVVCRRQYLYHLNKFAENLKR